MRVLIISKALLVGQYQTKLEALARKPNLQLSVLVPPYWRDERGVMNLERAHLDGYEFFVEPIAFNGHFHLYYYPSLSKILARLRPDILHLDEEPYNLATFHAVWNARRELPRARIIFFTWQNLLRRYPPPFSQMEKYVYANSDRAFAANQAAVQTLRAKGFMKPIQIERYGLDPQLFFPTEKKSSRDHFSIGFAGRLVQEKGIQYLLRALTRVEGDWDLRILGSGPLRDSLAKQSSQLGLAARVKFLGSHASSEMPGFFNSLDLFVLPSISRPNWQEQFGRVLVEAMACGVPVIGSSSGEIPNVIGDAGMIVPEKNVQALAEAIRALVHDPARRSNLAARGRARVLENFTVTRVVDQTYAAYCELMK